MCIEIETWLPIKGYERLYEVSSLGNIKSLERTCETQWDKSRRVEEKLLQPFLIKGYRYINLNKNGLKQFRIGRLVGKAFIPNPNNLPIINHKNGIKTDDNKDNLEWCTSKHNSQHAVAMGLTKGRKGEIHHNSYLTEIQVEEIRQKLADGVPGTDLAYQYYVSDATISNIKHNKNWIK